MITPGLFGLRLHASKSSRRSGCRRVIYHGLPGLPFSRRSPFLLPLTNANRATRHRAASTRLRSGDRFESGCMNSKDFPSRHGASWVAAAWTRSSRGTTRSIREPHPRPSRLVQYPFTVGVTLSRNQAIHARLLQPGSPWLLAGPATATAIRGSAAPAPIAAHAVCATLVRV